MKKCFFIGHRESPAEVWPALVDAVEHHIEQYGVLDFYVGSYGNFDRLAARAVILAKQTHPEITLSLLLPYHSVERTGELPPGFDGSYYPVGMETVPRRFAIVRANRYMIEQAEFLIAYVRHPASNAEKLVEYAKRRERKNLITVTCL